MGDVQSASRLTTGCWAVAKKGKSSRRTTARGEEGLIGRGVLERVIEAYTHPVATSRAEPFGPIDTESDVGGLGSDSCGGTAGKSGCTRSENVLVENIGVDVSGSIVGESQYIKI